MSSITLNIVQTNNDLNQTASGGAALFPLVLVRMGRHILYFVCFICLLVSSFMMLTAWERVARGEGRAAGVIKQGLQQPRDRAIASTVQGIRLVGMPEYKFYWVGNSTIPGAGLGVFARQNMPAGTLWNPEDANPESTLAIRLPLWQSLVGLVEYLKAAGHSNHPLTAVWSFFVIYGYICGDHSIVALTGNTFTNHAPEPPDSGGASSLQKGATTLNRKMATDPLQQLQGTGSSTVRYANSGEIAPTSRWAQGLSPWQICTTSVTLRDIHAGEEMLEDYFRYTPLCQGPNACPEFMHKQQQQQQQQQQQHSDFGSELDADEHPPEEWNHATMVQLHDTYAATSSGPGGSGLGVFATRDLSRGSVWNKEDAIHSFAITRGQWTMLLEFQESLKATRVSASQSSTPSSTHSAPMDCTARLMAACTCHSHIRCLPGEVVSWATAHRHWMEGEAVAVAVVTSSSCTGINNLPTQCA